MEYAILAAILLGAVAGWTGAAVYSWAWARRTLALEQQLTTLALGYDAHLQKLDKIVTSQVKTQAVNRRWSKKEEEDNALAEQLSALPGTKALIGHPWDPRTWGAEK
jgi:hypothetical protein